MIVYDILGREVITLINKNVKAGYHIIEWNGINSYGNKVATGLYFIQIQAGRDYSTQKMVLLK